MNRILFLVNTPMQLFNAAILSHTEFSNKTCDVYYTSNVSTEVCQLIQRGVFFKGYEISLVKDICKRTNAFQRALVRIKNALDIRTIMKSLPSDPDTYGEVFVSGISLRNCEWYYAIKKINKRVKISLYEEGLYEYRGFQSKNYLKIIFSYIFFHHYYLSECEALYVYRPEFVRCIWKNIRICKININADPEFLKKINQAFGYQKTVLDGSHKFIVLDQALYKKAEEDMQNELIHRLSSIVGREQLIVKLHPRSDRDKYKGEYEILNNNLPFELIALNEKIMGNIFVSILSSAAVNLYLMLNEEPQIIMLSSFLVRKGCAEFLEKVKNGFQSNTFWIPETIEEYEGIIRSLQSRLGAV